MPLVIGVDPGGTTGMAALFVSDRSKIINSYYAQLRGDESFVDTIVRALCSQWADVTDIHLAVESFVVSSRAGRSAHAGSGKQARDIIALLKGIGRISGSYVERPAVVVKRWATNQRLEAAGILGDTTGMQHARDASRHALYAAVRAGLLADPLSSKQTSAS
jgi:hypothetical protein